jgi:2-polyprenyl-3-methyl-5-hydroxy-6-metoxy-1,4-benzoquinol methylase
MLVRGGTSEERLYLHDVLVDTDEGLVTIKKTDMPDLENIIARHKARYHLPAFFCRPGMTVLDSPCGSGYGRELFPKETTYYGMDKDEATIQYCKEFYKGFFILGDLTNPNLPEKLFNVIACIEGLEHIDKSFQFPLIQAFHKALTTDGILVISSPMATGTITNPYHKHELTWVEFEDLLHSVFKDVQILSHKTKLHNSTLTENLYGICTKRET